MMSEENSNPKPKETKEIAEEKQLPQPIQVQTNQTGLIQADQQQSGQKNPKMVTISVDELLKWDKKSKDLTTQIKTLQIENSNLKMELEEKKQLNNSLQLRQDLSVEGLEERCKALQNILDEQSQKHQKLEQELRVLKEQNVNLKTVYESRENEIRSFRDSIKDKFDLERRLNEKSAECESLISQIRRYTEEAKNIEEKNKQIEKLQKEREGLLKECEEIREQQEGKNHMIQDLQAYQTSLSQALEQNRNIMLALQNHAEELNNEVKLKDGRIEEMKAQIEEIEGEKSIILKKSQNEIKDLKNQIIKEKSLFSTLLEDKNKLERDFKNLMEKRSSITSSPSSNSSQNNNNASSLSSWSIMNLLNFERKDSKQEKIILEALALRVSEMEGKIHLLEEKLRAEDKIKEYLERKLTGRYDFINKIIKEVYEQMPSLADCLQISELDLDEKINLQKIKSQSIDENQTMIEKVVLENFRLRKDLVILGSELNSLLRKTGEKNV